MHNDYYYTDIKGTPFRWKKSSIPFPNDTVPLYWVESHSLLRWCPLVLEWLFPEVMGNTSSEETYPLKQV